MARGNPAFALEPYAHLARKPGSLFPSPYRISTALAMAHARARGEDAREMAATAVVMERMGAAGRPVRFDADHPFLFLIRDRGTGSILFMGRVAGVS